MLHGQQSLCPALFVAEITTESRIEWRQVNNRLYIRPTAGVVLSLFENEGHEPDSDAYEVVTSSVVTFSVLQWIAIHG